MKSIILCEGKTDLILLSYYLGKVRDWSHFNRERKYKDRAERFNILDKNTQNYEWYWNASEDLLCIYAVGGIESLRDGLAQVLSITSKASGEPFDNIIILCDRDDDGVEEKINNDVRESLISADMDPVDITNNTWSNNIVYEKNGTQHHIRLLPLIIPFEEVGTLETFLLNCRASIDSCENELVVSCRCFVEEKATHEAISARYINKRGLRSKIELGIYFSIVSPNRTFDVGNEVLKSICWEEHQRFNKAFEKVLEL